MTPAPALRLAPCAVARSVPIHGGLTLDLEAPSPGAHEAYVADLAVALFGLKAGDVAAQRIAATRVGFGHFVVAVTDADGVRHPATSALLDELLATARARTLRDLFEAIGAAAADARALAAEGNGSRPSSAGGAAAASTTAATAPTPPGAGASAAPAGAAPTPAPRTTTH